MPNRDESTWTQADYQGGVQNYRGGFSVRVFKSGRTSVFREKDNFLQLFDHEIDAIDFIDITITLEKANE